MQVNFRSVLSNYPQTSARLNQNTLSIKGMGSYTRSDENCENKVKEMTAKLDEAIANDKVAKWFMDLAHILDNGNKQYRFYEYSCYNSCFEEIHEKLIKAGYEPIDYNLPKSLSKLSESKDQSRAKIITGCLMYELRNRHWLDSSAIERANEIYRKLSTGNLEIN